MNKIREGYKMTELGEIPSEWAISKIGELTEIKTGGTPSTKCEKYWKDGDIPWMASGDVNKKIINEVDGRITKSGMENSAAKLLPKDTVMIALNGQGKTKGTVAYLNIELTCNQSLAGFLPSYNVFNSKYLYYNLQSRYFEIRGLAGDGARNGLNLGLLREILIPIPSIKEQEKIASILSTVDEQIDNVDALIEKNKELKKGLMQTLLTKGIGHTKFKKTEIGEIPEEWDVKKLECVFEILDSMRKPIKASDREKIEGNIPYYGASGVIDWINDYI
ncbi:MAG: restriction endonuclease subunit S, partial [Clostridium sp.]